MQDDSDQNLLYPTVASIVDTFRAVRIAEPISDPRWLAYSRTFLKLRDDVEDHYDLPYEAAVLLLELLEEKINELRKINGLPNVFPNNTRQEVIDELNHIAGIERNRLLIGGMAVYLYYMRPELDLSFVQISRYVQYDPGVLRRYIRYFRRHFIYFLKFKLLLLRDSK
jgi:hypothetical protein